jgi:hypothetical protein
MSAPTRRSFLQGAALGASALALNAPALGAQMAGERPARPEGVGVLNPRSRVPVGLIIDDSTCLVNLNRFAMPQFSTAFGGTNKTYLRKLARVAGRDSRRVRPEVRRVVRRPGRQGKYSIVPYPACVGRLYRELPGWTDRELAASIDVVRSLITPSWDIHLLER